MAKFALQDFYSAARNNLGPRYKRVRGMDSNDWLHSIGLERRNVAADIAGAFGMLAIGAVVGVGLGLLFAPRRGAEIRNDIGRRARATADRFRPQQTEVPVTH